MSTISCYFSILSVLLLLALGNVSYYSVYMLYLCVHVVDGQLCPPNSFTYGSGTCVSIVSSVTVSFPQARAACQTSNRDLVTVATSGQLSALRGYVRSLGSAGGQYWIGYQYTSGNTLIGVDGSPAPSLITNELINEGADGLCTSILRNTSLINEDCNTNINGYICQFTTTCKLYTSVYYIIVYH